MTEHRLTEHQLTVRGVCPINGEADAYNCVVRTDGFLSVEAILAAAAKATEGPAFQEDITRAIAAQLEATDPKCWSEVVTHGIHSGVYTTCRVTGARS